MTPTRGRGRRGDISTGSSRQASSSGAEPDVDDLTLLGSDDGSDIERDGGSHYGGMLRGAGHGDCFRTRTGCRF
ncbi:hypothetical protein OROHE_005341 [Orobanche hederae]